MIDVALLSEFCKIPAAPGFEQRLRAVIMEMVAPLVDDVYTDSMGNVYALKKGTKQGNEAKRVMIGAHMDEIGFIVTHIEEGGFLRFHTLGGFDPKTRKGGKAVDSPTPSFLLEYTGAFLLGVLELRCRRFPPVLR